MALSDKQIEQYNEDGYVIPDYRLPKEKLVAIRADHDRLLTRFSRVPGLLPDATRPRPIFSELCARPEHPGHGRAGHRPRYHSVEF